MKRIISSFMVIFGAFLLLVLGYLAVSGFLYINAHGLKDSQDYLLSIAICALFIQATSGVIKWVDA